MKAFLLAALIVVVGGTLAGLVGMVVGGGVGLAVTVCLDIPIGTAAAYAFIAVNEDW